MAILKAGQVGDFNGKIGQVVVSKWRQLLVGRSTPKKSGKKASDVQLDQQSKFKLVTTFISRLGKNIALGYQNSVGNLTPYNVAVKHHLNTAVTGVYPDYVIDMSKVVLSLPHSKNEIDGIANVTMSNAVDGMVSLAWTKKSLSLNELTSDTDLVNVVFYNETEDAIMSGYADGTRISLKADVFIPQEGPADIIHAWLFMVSVSKKLVSKSIYLGVVEV